MKRLYRVLQKERFLKIRLPLTKYRNKDVFQFFSQKGVCQDAQACQHVTKGMKYKIIQWYVLIRSYKSCCTPLFPCIIRRILCRLKFVSYFFFCSFLFQTTSCSVAFLRTTSAMFDRPAAAPPRPIKPDESDRHQQDNCIIAVAVWPRCLRSTFPLLHFLSVLFMRVMNRSD